MSPTMTEGGIASWKKQEGETFVQGDVLVEIETDKATIDVEAQDDGIMVKIMVSELHGPALRYSVRLWSLRQVFDLVSQQGASQAPSFYFLRQRCPNSGLTLCSKMTAQRQSQSVHPSPSLAKKATMFLAPTP